MNFIPMQVLEYRFNEAGETTQIVVGFQTYSGAENLNARLNLTIEDIKTANQNWDFSSMTQDRCELVARRKLQAWVRVERPENPVEPEGPVDPVEPEDPEEQE